MSEASADFGKDPSQMAKSPSLNRILIKIGDGFTHRRISRRLIVGFGSPVAEIKVPDAYSAGRWSLRRTGGAWMV